MRKNSWKIVRACIYKTKTRTQFVVCGWCFADAKSRRKRKRGTTETAVSSTNFNHCWFRGSLGCLSSKLFPGNRRKRRDLESTTHSNHRRHSRLTVCWLLGHRIVCVFSQPSFLRIFIFFLFFFTLFMLLYKFLTRSSISSILRIGYLSTFHSNSTCSFFSSLFVDSFLPVLSFGNEQRSRGTRAKNV